MNSAVQIWFLATDTLDADAVRAAEETLSADERTRANRFRFSEDRRDYVVAHDLLRRALSQLESIPPADWVFDAGEHGKPFVSSSDLTFSLSHTRGFVACAASRQVRLGLDVERVDRAVNDTEIAERVFARSEAEALERMPHDQRAPRFMELWTLKEAYVKATGLGLSQPLTELSFDLSQESRIGYSLPGDADREAWAFALFAPSSSVRLAIAVSGKTGESMQFIMHLADKAAHAPTLRPFRTSF